MKLFLPCLTCGIPGGVRTNWVESPAQESRVYRLTCNKGHRTVLTIDAHQFHVLFTIAINAILDGYHREAVLSFTASLERFHEYYVQVVMRRLGIPANVYSEFRNLTRNASERELGAFFVAYMMETGTSPRQLNSIGKINSKMDFVNFRNRVAHQGLIPTRDEAVKFGEVMLHYAQPMLIELKEKYFETVMFKLRQDETAEIQSKAYAEAEPGETVGGTSFFSAFSNGTYAEDSFLDIAVPIEMERRARMFINEDIRCWSEGKADGKPPIS